MSDEVIPKFLKVESPYPIGMVSHFRDSGVTSYNFDIQTSSSFLEFLSLSIVKYYYAESTNWLTEINLLNHFLQSVENNPLISSFIDTREFSPFLADFVVSSLVSETSVELVDNKELNKACKILIIAFIAYGIYSRKSIRSVSKWSKSDIYDLQLIADAHLRILKAVTRFYFSLSEKESFSIIQIPADVRKARVLIHLTLIIADDCLIFLNEDLVGIDLRNSTLTKLENKGLYKSHNIIGAFNVCSSTAKE